LFEEGRGLADVTLDLRGLHCPLPILRARKALSALPPRSALEVFADDPLSPVDFEAFCQASGDALVESDERDGVFRFLIRRAG
jgi:tRNA 2-thiouridine synthesizing protein A